MANIFKIDRTGNEIILGTTGTTINIASHTASKILALDAGKDLEVVTIGTSLDYTRPTLNTIQDIRTTAGPTFGTLFLTSGLAYITLKNSTDEYGEGGCETLLRFNDHAAHNLAQIEGSHSGTLDDNKGKMILATNTGAGLTIALTFDDLQNATFTSNLILPKTSGNGIKVDTTTPTFGWRDLLGEPTTKNTGATKPSYEAYNGAIDGFRYSDGDEEQHEYHVPHDYVLGTDIYLHIHWSQISATNTGGTIDFKYSAVYSKGHNQAAFTSTPITDTITSADAGSTQYQHHITEQIMSGASATAALFDRDDIEPDGVILLTLEMDSNDLTDSGAVTDPFIHFVDIHYQSTNIATKQKAPDFYT